MQYTPTPFPKITAYRGTADPTHMAARVVCMEKLDGAGVRIGAHPQNQRPQDLAIGGRTLMENHERFSQPFLPPVIRNDTALCQGLLALSAELNQEVALYGELCGAKIQKTGFIYGSRLHFVLFAAKIGRQWVGPTRSCPLKDAPTPPTLAQIAQKTGATMAPILYEGPPNTDIINNLIDRPSAHSQNRGFARHDIDTTHEGIVIWSDPVLLMPDGHPIVAKFKHPSRSEYTAAGPQGADETPSAFASRVINAERIAHARQHLRETGRWSADGAENQRLTVRRAIQDVSKEVPEYPSALRTHGKKALRAALKAQARLICQQNPPNPS